ncbi:THAP domain-containing protein 10-like isoform X1 [Rhipicephalus sanguineus]|uniref:THAP domain-containing protein 10-like isoform X1 n=1 Tax=Rhipicephalus sanguineus TaxID=34632 RepID=UPI0018930E03|nr:THAP domain-containing protein 10-like isoform X1 [Rhipicephalus sanguineus]
MPKAFCAVPFCPSKTGSGVSLHSFPRDEPRRQRWIEFVRSYGRQDWSPVPNSRVCGLHFQAYWFSPKLPDLTCMGFWTRPRAVLMSGAVPSVRHASGYLAPEQGDASLSKCPRHETCSDRGHEPDLPLHMPTHLCASGNDKATTAGCFVANVHTQCHVEVGIRGTQAALKPASRSTGVQTRLTVLPVEAVLKATQVALKRASRSTGGQTRPRVFCVEVDMEDAKVVLKPASRSTDVHTRSTDVHTRSADVHTRPTVVWLKSSTPCPKPSLVCSEPSPTNKDDPQDETYKPKFNSSEAH